VKKKSREKIKGTEDRQTAFAMERIPGPVCFLTIKELIYTHILLTKIGRYSRTKKQTGSQPDFEIEKDLMTES
jgi:hypothetical protein